MSVVRLAQRALPTALLIAGALALIAVASAPSDAARALDLPVDPAANRLFWAGLLGAIALLVIGTGRVIHAIWRRGRGWGGLARDQRGTIMVEFALALGPLMWMMFLIAHLSVVANTALVVAYAAHCGARSCAVNYGRATAALIPERLPANRSSIDDASDVVLCILSPVSPLAPAQNHAANAMGRLFIEQDGIWGIKDFQRRMMYTRLASTVTITDSDSPTSALFQPVADITPPRVVTVTVRYLMIVRIPGITAIPGLTEPAPLGAGRVVPIEQTVSVQCMPGRVTPPAGITGPFPFP